MNKPTDDSTGFNNNLLEQGDEWWAFRVMILALSQYIEIEQDDLKYCDRLSPEEIWSRRN